MVPTYEPQPHPAWRSKSCQWNTPALSVAALFVLALPLPLTAQSAANDWKEEPFEIKTVAPLERYASEPIDPVQWRPTQQSDLAGQLATAHTLQLDPVGPAPKRCWTGHRPYIVPNPNGKSWDMLLPYYNKYRGEQEIVIHDFGTGETTTQVLSTRKGDSVLTKEAIGFHMQPSYYTHGKLVFKHYGPVLFTVYDPAVNRFVKGVKPFGDSVVAGNCVLGEDGMIYGMGWPKDKSGFVAFCFDPVTYETKRSETFGPANPKRRELYRGVIMSGDWLYADIGTSPWHLVAYNFKTEEGRLLATTKDIIGSGATIQMKRVSGGLRGTITEPAFVDGMGQVDAKAINFWLHDGQILKRDDNAPPWPTEGAKPEGGETFRWSREFQVWPTGFTPPSPPPMVENESGDPDGTGRVSLKYAFKGSKEPHTLEYVVKMYPGEVQLLTEVNDHVLFATDSGYGQQVFYNLKTRQILPVGGTSSPYSIGHVNNRWYVSGYPSTQVYEYDFSRPIGLRQAKPNPRRVGYLGRTIDAHTPLGGTVGASDGRVYCGSITYGRQRNGGGFGWCDPKTGEMGGIKSTHRFFWMALADNGRYVLASTKATDGGNGKLFCWDTQAKKIIYEKEILGRPTPGPIVEALPGGLVIGHTTAPEGGGVLYGLLASTGEVLWTKPVPATPITSQSRVRRHAYSFRRGPDGYIWAYFGKTLVRINPVNAIVHPVGQLDPPAQIAFAVDRVFIAGGKEIRQIKELQVHSKK